jgi:hypothetical protein
MGRIKRGDERGMREREGVKYESFSGGEGNESIK